MQGDKYVVSTGGNDRCVFQWVNVKPSKNQSTEDEAGAGIIRIETSKLLMMRTNFWILSHQLVMRRATNLWQ